MKAYLFSHKGLSSIQKGVQTTHAVTEMFNAYDPHTPEHAMLMEWTKTHKTISHYDAGFSGPLKRIYSAIRKLGDDHGLPYACFHEDEETFEGILTACAIIIPDFEIRTDFSAREEIADPCPRGMTNIEMSKSSNFTMGERFLLLKHGLRWAT